MRTEELTKAGVITAIGIVLPTFFHLFAIPGTVFLPMHIPSLIGGFLLQRGEVAFFIGFFLPLLSFLITGMPPFPLFLVMMFEVGSYALFAWYFYQGRKWTIFPSLLLSLVMGKVVAIVANWILALIFLERAFNFWVVLESLLIVAFPGILIQVILIPFLVKGVERWKKK